MTVHMHRCLDKGMAKRGETRPWRVRFEWESGIAATQTHGSKDAALDAVKQLHRNSHMRDASIVVTVSNRETGKSWAGEHDPATCESEHE